MDFARMSEIHSRLKSSPAGVQSCGTKLAWHGSKASNHASLHFSPARLARRAAAPRGGPAVAGGGAEEILRGLRPLGLHPEYRREGRQGEDRERGRGAFRSLAALRKTVHAALDRRQGADRE